MTAGFVMIEWPGISKGGAHMRSRWFALSMVVVAFVGVGLQASVAGASSSSAKQLSLFKKLDGPYSEADNKWTNALSSLSSNATVAQVSKPSLAFVPAIKTFDSGLQKAGFTGAIATEVADDVKLNGQLIKDLTSIKSVSSLQAELEPLFAKYSPIQDALAKDFGIPAGDIVV
jgi:hypothetical protein